MIHPTLQKFAFLTLAAGLLAASQGALAHTRMTTSTATEGTTVYNNMGINHGCPAVSGTAKEAVIANSTVFPDGTDSTFTVGSRTGTPLSGTFSDYFSWGSNLAIIQSEDVFTNYSVNWGRGAQYNQVVGVKSWGGNLPGNGVTGLVPIKISGVTFPKKGTPDFSTTCAQSVTFVVATADVCRKAPRQNLQSKQTVNLWTPAVGSHYDASPSTSDAYDSPATYKVTRDLTNNPLPDNCSGVGIDIFVTPSAAQLNHDMPIPGWLY